LDEAAGIEDIEKITDFRMRMHLAGLTKQEEI